MSWCLFDWEFPIPFVHGFALSQGFDYDRLSIGYESEDPFAAFSDRQVDVYLVRSSMRAMHQPQTMESGGKNAGTLSHPRGKAWFLRDYECVVRWRPVSARHVRDQLVTSPVVLEVMGNEGQHGQKFARRLYVISKFTKNIKIAFEQHVFGMNIDSVDLILKGISL